MAKLAKFLQGVAGAAGGAGLNVEDVFSTYLYTGNGSTQTITNGIDLAGEGGLVWIKSRDTAASPNIVDTERGDQWRLLPNGTTASIADSDFGTFTSSGFSLDGNNQMNTNASAMVSWTFRKAPKFFTCLTYTGNNTNGRQIEHDLGSVPGCIIVKCTSTTGDWEVYHRGVDATAPEDYALQLNQTAARQDLANRWNDTAPTSTHFTLGDNGNVNADGFTYVAYLFAHNDGDGEFGPTRDQDIIKCGSYTGNGSTTGPEIDLGFEPQWLLWKCSNSAENWFIIDNMRKWTAKGHAEYLIPNLSNAEAEYDSTSSGMKLYSKGFQPTNNSNDNNGSGKTYIYIAIRRGQMKTPESASEVFSVDNYTADDTDRRTINNGILTDMVMARNTNSLSDYGFLLSARGMQSGFDTTFLKTNRIGGEDADGDTFMEPTSGYGTAFSSNTGFTVGNDVNASLNYSTRDQIAYSWKRANGFFDVMQWVSINSSDHRLEHNLGVTPEMAILKPLSASGDFYTYHKDLGTSAYIRLNGSYASSSLTNAFPNPSATEFGFRENVFVSAGTNMIGFFFASLDGIAKVGSYTGNGSSQTIDCGFNSGASMVLIKKSSGVQNWKVFDSARGIVAGNDYLLELNDSAAQSNTYDDIDPHSSGFIVNEDGENINTNGETYIFYAIA